MVSEVNQWVEFINDDNDDDDDEHDDGYGTLIPLCAF